MMPTKYYALLARQRREALELQIRHIIERRDFANSPYPYYYPGLAEACTRLLNALEARR